MKIGNTVAKMHKWILDRTEIMSENNSPLLPSTRTPRLHWFLPRNSKV